MHLLELEGIQFEYGADVGGPDLPADELRARHDAVVIAIGSRVPRELEVPGRELDGVHLAMDYLYIRNRYVASISDEGIPGPEPEVPIVAEGKDVVVIGGGDTGMDCISNANREGATSATLLDVYPEIPVGGRYDDTPWPMPLKRSVTTYALDEGGERRFGVQVAQLRGDADGQVRELVGRHVTGTSSRNLEAGPGLGVHDAGRPGPDRGRLHRPGAPAARRASASSSTCAATSRRRCSHRSESGVFACGDARVGQSLIVTAIAEGRRCARITDRWLRTPSARAHARTATATRPTTVNVAIAHRGSSEPMPWPLASSARLRHAAPHRVGREVTQSREIDEHHRREDADLRRRRARRRAARARRHRRRRGRAPGLGLDRGARRPRRAATARAPRPSWTSCSRSARRPKGLDGATEGILVAPLIQPLVDRVAGAITSLWMPWQGKSFDAAAERGNNRLTGETRWIAKLLWPLYGTKQGPDGERLAFDFETRIEPGMLDPDTEVLVIDYAPVEDNPGLIIKSIRDELVEIVPGANLGKILYRRGGGYSNIGFFALRS